jgi:hypothetical protein
MNRKQCRNTRREIDELESGQQPGEQASAHLAVCSTCRDFRDERADLRRLVASLEPVVAPADFDMRLRARIAGERQTDRQQPFFVGLIGTPAIAAAALVVLVVGSIVWVAQRKGDQSPTVPTRETAVNPGADPTVVQTKTNSVEDNAVAPERGADLLAHNTGKPSGPGKGRPSIHRPASSRDFNVSEARSIRQGDVDETFVNAPSKPVVVSFQNERGTTRKISLPPVSFGAQSLVDNRVANYSPNSRIW